jgi:hypothetical protein
MTRWGKVRVTNGGDKICASCAVREAQARLCRDSSFVRVVVHNCTALRAKVLG